MVLRRIALISSSFDPYTGGVEEHTRHVARELQARGHHVVVWTVDRGERLGVRTVDGLTVRYLSTPLPSRSLGGVGRFLRQVGPAALAWRRAMRADRPDLLHVQCFGPNGLYAVATHHLTRLPLVVSAHGETFADDHSVFTQSRLSRRSLTHALVRATAVTGCSQMVLDDLHARFGGPGGVVVHNGVDLDEAVLPMAGDASTLHGGSAGTEGAIAAIGRLEWIKGFDLLIRAFALAALDPEMHLVIGGDGAQQSSLTALASELGVADRVVLPGRLSRAEVAAVIGRAGVVVVPSRHEAFGITVLEAWRAGRPVIATSRGGPREFVTHGVDGLLVDPEDVAGLARSLVRVVNDQQLAERLGRAGAGSVVDYTWKRTVDSYERIYGEFRG